MTWWSSVPAPPGLPQRCTEHPRAFPPWCWTNLPRAGRRRPRHRSRTTSVPRRAVVQARKFGAVFTIPGEAQSLDFADGYHRLRLADGEELTAHTVILATGVQYKRLDIPGMERLEAPSVYYAATESEAQGRSDPVTVVGGGNSAGQATIFLARRA